MMSNEEFQRLVLEKLTNFEEEFKSLVEGQESLVKVQKFLVERQESLVKGQDSLVKGQKALEDRQMSLEKTLSDVVEQTANLTEFKEEIINELQSMKASIARVEIATANNWSDIARLKAII